MRPLPLVVPFWQAGLAQDCWGHVLGSHGIVPAVTAKLQHKCQEQRSAVTERPGDRECELPLGREVVDQAVESGARIGHQIWDSSTLPQVTGLAPNRPKIVRVFELYL
jgi:hypothetical protein